MTHTKTTAVVWGTAPPASLDRSREADVAGRLRVHGAVRRRPDPDEVEGADDPRISLVCLRCLLDDHPEIGRGLDIARQYGVADLDENDEWVVGDLSRLE